MALVGEAENRIQAIGEASGSGLREHPVSGSHQCRFALPISALCFPHFSFSLAKPLISIAAS